MAGRALAFALVAALSAPMAPVAAQDAALSLRLPAEEKAQFRGVASFDGVQGAFQPLYVAPNAAAALVQLIAHGVTMDAMEKSRLARIQEGADAVLTPHREVLEKLTNRELLEHAAARMAGKDRKRLVEFADKEVPGTVLEGAPVFAMTPDRRSLLVDNAISVRRPGDAAGKGFQVMVRVVSAPRPPENLVAYWTDDDGARLKEESAALLALSLDTALQAAAGTAADGPQRTVRYRQGAEEKIERAQVLAEVPCERLLMRNLRGWLMSVPLRCD